MIYQECDDTEFRKDGIRPPNPIREYDLTDKSKDCCFHIGNDHNTYDFIQLKYVIEVLIKKGWPSKYINGGKQDPKESPKAKSPRKFYEVGPSGDKGDTFQGKCMYIAVITGKAPWANLSSKWMVKRKIVEMTVVYKKEGSSSSKFSDQPMLGFRESKKVWGITN